jgi:hypothetical protein
MKNKFIIYLVLILPVLFSIIGSAYFYTLATDYSENLHYEQYEKLLSAIAETNSLEGLKVSCKFILTRMMNNTIDLMVFHKTMFYIFLFFIFYFIASSLYIFRSMKNASNQSLKSGTPHSGAP